MHPLRFLITLVLLAGARTNLHAQNVMISNLGNPNEPSIMIDPKNPAVLVAGANLNNVYTSSDTGHTWTRKILTSSFGVWGDPAIAVDTESNFYFFHLSNPPVGNGSFIDRIVSQKSTNNGASWSNGSFTGLNGTKAQDKQWSAIDRSNNAIYLTWTQFDNYGSAAPADSSVILFSKSIDAGASWSPPVRINKIAGDCLDGDNTVEGAVPAVGPNGEIYVSWAGPAGLVFNKSMDGGTTWLPVETVVDPFPGGWDFDISGISRANGLPVTTCDVGNGPNRGTIYVNWADQRNGIGNTDIWLVKSTDGGQTWTAPARVNDDASNRQQFFTWMTIDPTNGNLYFVFYDRRNHAGDSTDVYMALSTDGGTTFVNRKISESPFLPNAGVFFGDYTNVTAYNGTIRPIWTRLNNGQLSIWTDITRVSDFAPSVGIRPLETAPDLAFENYPNPAGDYEWVSFKLHMPSQVSLSVFDEKGKMVAEIIKRESRGYGKYVEEIPLKKFHLPGGIYFLKLQIDGKTTVNRLLKL